MSTVLKVKEELDNNDIEYDESVLQNVVTLLAKFHFTLEDLVNEWQSFTFCHDYQGVLDNTILHKWEKKLSPNKPIPKSANNKRKTQSQKSRNKLQPRQIMNQSSFKKSFQKNKNKNKNKSAKTPTTNAHTNQNTKAGGKKSSAAAAEDMRYFDVPLQTPSNTTTTTNTTSMQSDFQNINMTPAAAAKEAQQQQQRHRTTDSDSAMAMDDYKDSVGKENNAHVGNRNRKSSRSVSVSTQKTTLLDINLSQMNARGSGRAGVSPSILQSPALNSQAAYKKGRNSGQILTTFNPHLAHSHSRSRVIEKASVTEINNIIFEELSLAEDENAEAGGAGAQNQHPYRFMFEDEYSKQEMLKNWISKIGQCIHRNMTDTAAAAEAKASASANANANTTDHKVVAAAAEDVEMNAAQPESAGNEDHKAEEDEDDAHEIVFVSVRDMCQSKQFFLGRIMNEMSDYRYSMHSQRSTQQSGKDGNANANANQLSVHSLILEGDWDYSYGQRVKLDISQLTHYSLFPGQIVCVEGVHSSSDEILVTNIFQNASIPKPLSRARSTKADHSVVHSEDNGGENVNVYRIVCAVGPFTGRSSLEFAQSPMFDLANVIAEDKCPHLIVLMGPFTDMENECLAKNEVSFTYQELFEQLLFQFLAHLESRGCDARVIVIPSVRDIHHVSCFPQSPYVVYDRQNLSTLNNHNQKHNHHHNRVEFLSNPTQFRLKFEDENEHANEVNMNANTNANTQHEINFGVVNVDFLYHCVQQSIFKADSDPDIDPKLKTNRLQSTIEHCLLQQNFYPMSPASTSVRMDYTQFSKLCMCQSPDILIMPSTMKQFAFRSSIQNVICINPSFLTRINTGGSYALISIHQPAATDANTEVDMTDHIRVDIIRI